MSYLSLCFLYLHANQISQCQETDHGLLALECTLFPSYLFIPVKSLPVPPVFFFVFFFWYLAVFLPFRFVSFWPILALPEAILLHSAIQPWHLVMGPVLLLPWCCLLCLQPVASAVPRRAGLALAFLRSAHPAVTRIPLNVQQ